ncbi:MAG: glucokinase [Candidatus Rokubacteria bacterium RIFCSPLOWO2_12_FULL_71_22]|nr:MAG: glucokinase [Candidatus Rokubacteria bacterium RIFCSPLOWO2_12_FULL_71_22]
MLLAGDVGGTKTALALFEPHGADLAPVREVELPSRDFPALEAAIARFLAGGPRVAIEAACFGAAGPVVDGRCRATNLPWELDERVLAAAIPARKVRLLNDLAAAAHGVLGLPRTALATLQEGTPRAGNMALIAPGTGLGEALLIRAGARHVVVGSEGGHADYAPRSDLESELLAALRREHGHVSWERVVSGPGLVAVYRFLRARGGVPEPEWLAARLAREDAGAVVTEAALAGKDPVCARALDLFVANLGAEAGNLALRALALGGVFVGGGIAPRIRAKLEDGTFVAAFCDKGRFASLLVSIPVHIVLEPRAALLGAARIASSLVSGD